MSELPISMGDIQGIINFIGPYIKEKYIYGFYSVIKSNRDHIDLALERLEKETNKIVGLLVQDFLENGKQLPQGTEEFLKSIATIKGFEDKSKSAMNNPIIGQLLEVWIIQDEEFQKIVNRTDHSMNSFMSVYRKESLKYAEGGVPNIKLLNKERKKLIIMAEKCMQDLHLLLSQKIINFLQLIIVQSIKSSTPQNIDIKNIQEQFSILEKKNYYKEVIVCFDKFLGEMIDLIATE